MQQVTTLLQRFQPSETRKREVYKFSWFWFFRGSGAFCLKICDVLAQQDEFSTTLWSRLAVCKVHNERNLPWIFTILSGFFSCFNKLAFEVEFLLTRFQRISITNWTLVRRKQKTGGFEAKTGGRKRSLKTGGFRLKREGWNLCCCVLLASNVASVCMGLNVWRVSNYTQQVPTLLWFPANGRNMVGPAMLRVVSQQCCIRLHGP